MLAPPRANSAGMRLYDHEMRRVGWIENGTGPVTGRGARTDGTGFGRVVHVAIRDFHCGLWELKLANLFSRQKVHF
jgi:hypothetical protein